MAYKPKSECLVLRCTPEQKVQITSAARDKGLDISAYLRSILLNLNIITWMIMINSNCYRPSDDFMKVRDAESCRHHRDRVGSLIMYQHLTERQAETMLIRIDIELSLEFDCAPFNTDHYTRKVDEYVEDILNEDNTYIRNLVAQCEETLILDDFW